MDGFDRSVSDTVLNHSSVADLLPKDHDTSRIIDLDYEVTHSKQALLKAPFRPTGGKLKRALDISLSSGAIFFLSPFFLLLWMVIKLESRGPGFFKQSRGGFNGQPFEIYKFRTMRVHDGPVKQAVKGDSRITPIGSFLRKTSIDELPQLFNVLKGDMSIVGPRPHAIDHDREFQQVDFRYSQRFKARPGITGLAQVSGSRGITDTPDKIIKRVDFDTQYVNEWSLTKDITIILKTVILVFRDDQAF